MDNTKKWILAIFLIVLVILLGCLSFNNNYQSNNESNLHNNTDNKTLSRQTTIALNDYSDDMPKVSSTQYIFNENKTLNQVVIQGNFIHSYKRIFMNTTRADYDVESTYRNFNNDFEEYRVNLKNMIINLQSENPAASDGKYEQSQTITKLNRLYNKISDYKNHNSHINDTLKFLKECETELNSVNNQAKLPIN